MRGEACFGEGRKGRGRGEGVGGVEGGRRGGGEGCAISEGEEGEGGVAALREVLRVELRRWVVCGRREGG